jgi:hypothetical protein
LKLIDADAFDNELVKFAYRLHGNEFRLCEQIRALLENQPEVPVEILKSNLETN